MKTGAAARLALSAAVEDIGGVLDEGWIRLQEGRKMRRAAVSSPVKPRRQSSCCSGPAARGILLLLIRQQAGRARLQGALGNALGLGVAEDARVVVAEDDPGRSRKGTSALREPVRRLVSLVIRHH